MTANTHRGEVEIALVLPEGGRKTFVLRPTWQALAEIEELTGKGLHALARGFLQNDFAFRDVVAVVTAGLKAAGEPASFEKVADLVFRTGFRNCCEAAALLLFQALRGDTEADLEETPGEAGAAEGKAKAWPSAATSG